MSKSQTMTCGGESPEGRHERIQTEMSAFEANRAHKERHSVGQVLVNPDPAQRISSLEYTIKCFEGDFVSMESDLRRLRKIENAFNAQILRIKEQDAEIRRLNQLLSGN
jgi:hypothetical protein